MSKGLYSICKNIILQLQTRFCHVPILLIHKQQVQIINCDRLEGYFFLSLDDCLSPLLLCKEDWSLTRWHWQISSVHSFFMFRSLHWKMASVNCKYCESSCTISAKRQGTEQQTRTFLQIIKRMLQIKVTLLKLEHSAKTCVISTFVDGDSKHCTMGFFSLSVTKMTLSLKQLQVRSLA